MNEFDTFDLRSHHDFRPQLVQWRLATDAMSRQIQNQPKSTISESDTVAKRKVKHERSSS